MAERVFCFVVDLAWDVLDGFATTAHNMLDRRATDHV